jgi:hypothetical protein
MRAACAGAGVCAAAAKRKKLAHCAATPPLKKKKKKGEHALGMRWGMHVLR